MSTETYTAGQTVQYRKVGKFELIERKQEGETIEAWIAKQLTGRRAKYTADDGLGLIWLNRDHDKVVR